MLRNTNVPEIRTSAHKIDTMSADEKFREQLRIREKAELDYNTDIFCAKTEGRAEGRDEERADTISRLKRMGMSDEAIREFYAD